MALSADFETPVLIAFADPESSGIDQARALQLLSQLPNPAAVIDEDGSTLLHYVCRNGWDDAVTLLVETYKMESEFQCVLLEAFTNPDLYGINQTRALQLLSQHPKPVAAIKCEDGRSLLFYACKSLLHYAYSNEWDEVVDVLVKNLKQESASGYEQIVLETFLDPEAVDTDQIHPRSSISGEAYALQLLSQLPNPTAVRDEDGSTLLHYACRNGWDDAVSLLVETYKMESEFQCILLEAFTNPDLYGIDQTRALQLLSQHPDPTAVRDEDGWTLLHYACRNGWDNVANMLMEERIQCQALDPVIILAFKYPSTTGTNQARALQLLSQLPNPAVIRDRDRGLLHYALRNEWADTVEVLTKGESASGLKHIVLEVFMRPEVFSTDQTHSESSGINQALILQLLSQLRNPAAVRDEDGCTLLHWACKNGWCDVVQALVEKHHCDPKHYIGLLKVCSHMFSLRVVETLESNIDGSEEFDIGFGSFLDSFIKFMKPLHCASQHGHLNIVKYLVKQGCDPDCRGILNVTPLHYACVKGHLSIVKFLVTKHCCNPLQQVSIFGLKYSYTPLHMACYSGHFEVVAFLLSSGKIDQLMASNKPPVLVKMIMGLGNVSVDRALYWQGSEKILFPFLACRRSNPFHPAFKVFVMGNPSAGKSTLVKAIQSRMTSRNLLGSFTAKFKKVSGVQFHTAGIIPVPIESKDLGSIIMYDLAGQYQYYSSHAALLEKLVASPGALLMVVVDLSKNREEIIQTLQYWNSFIENHCIQTKPSIIIIGSHADVVTLQQEDPAQKSKDIIANLSISLQKPDIIIPLNCTRLASGGLTKVCDVIARKCNHFQLRFDIDLQVHFLYAFLSRGFKGQTACKVLEIVVRIAKKENTELDIEMGDVMSFKTSKQTVTLLPQDTATLSQHLTTLSEKGRFLYLSNDQNIEDSWVILQQEMLLSEVNGTIFAPENFKEHHDISSSTGVVPFSKIKEIFPSHNPEMIISFLSHLEFCQQIAESEASVISEGLLGSSQQPSETFYFFPALVSEDRPEERCKSIEQTHYKCGWSLQCVRPDQFLSPRFLHVLLLRLAFSFALAPEAAEGDTSSPVLQRRCNVWKAGIHWHNRDGVKTIVEVVEQNTAVTVMMGCLEECEVACAKLRSEVIQTILEAKERFCGAVELRESLIHPTELSSYPLKSPKLLPSFTITELATAIAEDKKVVTSERKMLGISKLLYFEPYTCFNPTLLAEMFKNENSDKKVSDVFHLDAGKAAHSKMNILMKILDHNASELQVAIATAQASQTYQNDPMHHCYLLFRTWALCSPNPTYQALRSALDRFSVFCGRNPLLLADQCQVSSPQSNTVTANKTKPKPTRESQDHHDTGEDHSAIPHRSDKPCLPELQCLQGRGRRVVRVVEGVAAHWEDLAKALHFDTSVIECVRDMFHQTEDACREVLRRWLEGQGETRQPVNWATLIDSLLEAGFVDVAEDLQEVVEDTLLP